MILTDSSPRLGDHPSASLRASLGSTSLTTDSNGAKVSEMRYKPCPLRYTSGMLREGEVRYTWTAGLTTTPAYRLADYTLRQAQDNAFIRR
ncbi:MAG: hypothetical protein ACOYYI_02675 [Chloroflexota bacterium]